MQSITWPERVDYLLWVDLASPACSNERITQNFLILSIAITQNFLILSSYYAYREEQMVNTIQDLYSLFSGTYYLNTFSNISCYLACVL